MIAVFEANTANAAWLQAYNAFMSDKDTPQISRLGKTKEILHANFHITDPRQRWILSRQPALNPAFAIAEVFWILAGDNDAAFLNYWNPILPKFSGDGPKYHGAYGYRLRRQFGFDQLERAYNVLSCNPSSRQVVLQIWDPAADFPSDDGAPVSTDIPCNICAIPKIREGKLEWLQIMRSNDIYLGTPHNFVQFSTLQEVLAGWLGLELGAYHHISDSLHIYEKDIVQLTVDENIIVPLNDDRLSIGKHDFNIQMGTIIPAIAKLTSPSLNNVCFDTLIFDSELVESYRNLFLILAADAARRRGWKEEMHKSLILCTNELLCTAFKRWEQRRPICESLTN